MKIHSFLRVGFKKDSSPTDEDSHKDWDKDLLPSDELLEDEEDYLQETEVEEEELLSVELQEKLLNLLMVDGKKSKASAILKEAGALLSREKKEGLEKLLVQAVNNTAPPMKIRYRRRGSQKVRVPFPLTEKQRQSLGLRMILEEARKGAGPSLSHKLAREVVEASEGRGKAVDRQRQLALEAQNSRGNLFLRWS